MSWQDIDVGDKLLTPQEIFNDSDFDFYYAVNEHSDGDYGIAIGRIAVYTELLNVILTNVKEFIYKIEDVTDWNVTYDENIDSYFNGSFRDVATYVADDFSDVEIRSNVYQSSDAEDLANDGVSIKGSYEFDWDVVVDDELSLPEISSMLENYISDTIDNMLDAQEQSVSNLTLGQIKELSLNYDVTYDPKSQTVYSNLLNASLAD